MNIKKLVQQRPHKLTNEELEVLRQHFSGYQTFTSWCIQEILNLRADKKFGKALIESAQKYIKMLLEELRHGKQ